MFYFKYSFGFFVFYGSTFKEPVRTFIREVAYVHHARFSQACLHVFHAHFRTWFTHNCVCISHICACVSCTFAPFFFCPHFCACFMHIFACVLSTFLLTSLMHNCACISFILAHVFHAHLRMCLMHTCPVFDAHLRICFVQICVRANDWMSGRSHAQACAAMRNATLPMFRRVKDDRRYNELPGCFPLNDAYTEVFILFFYASVFRDNSNPLIF